MTSIRSRRRPEGFAIGSLLAVALAFGTIIASPHIAAQPQPAPLSYTAGQADQGRAAYGEHCASCHGPNLDDGAYGPPLQGNDFRQKWGSRSAEALFTYISSKMPPTRPGSLSDPTYAQLLALILQDNGSRRDRESCPPTPRP